MSMMLASFDISATKDTPSTMAVQEGLVRSVPMFLISSSLTLMNPQSSPSFPMHFHDQTWYGCRGTEAAPSHDLEICSLVLVTDSRGCCPNMYDIPVRQGLQVFLHHSCSLLEFMLHNASLARRTKSKFWEAKGVTPRELNLPRPRGPSNSCFAPSRCPTTTPKISTRTYQCHFGSSLRDLKTTCHPILFKQCLY